VVLRLSQFNIDPKNWKFGVTSFESDRQVSVKETDPSGKPILATIDLSSQQVNRKPIKADMALSHPEKNILALSAKK
jgi:clathrin heavy chain